MKRIVSTRMAANSRNPRHILSAVMLIFGIGLIVSYLVEAKGRDQQEERFISKLPTYAAPLPLNLADATEEEFLLNLWSVKAPLAGLGPSGDEFDPQPGEGEFLEVFGETAWATLLQQQITQSLPNTRFSPAQQGLFKNYVSAVIDGGKLQADAVAALVSTVNRPGETRLSAAMLGDFYTTRREPARALEAFLVETERSGWRPAWRRATMLALSLEDRVALQRIGSSAGGLEALKSLSTTQQAQVAGLLDDYGQVLKIMALHVWQLAVNHRLSTFVTLVAGLIWYILLHNVAGLSLLRWKSIVAVALGVLSPVLTLFFLHLQEDLNKFQLTGDPVNDLVYYVAGVALREEVSKLLLFCPLLFFLRRSQLVEILTVSACVGLGFAIEENIGYFGSTPSGVVWARFMTANFLHCALTGLAGLALFQLLFGSTHAWHEHLLTILAMIAAHGVYNYLLGDYGGHPTFQNNGLSIVVLIAVSWRYFVLVRLHRQPSYQHIGPLFLFLCGLSLLFSVSLACTSWQIGLDYAFQFLSIGVLSTVVLAIFYCQRVHDL